MSLARDAMEKMAYNPTKLKKGLTRLPREKLWKAFEKTRTINRAAGKSIMHKARTAAGLDRAVTLGDSVANQVLRSV